MPKADQDQSLIDMILGERKVDYKIMCKLLFGAYAQVHVHLETTKTMESRMTGGINLGPTGNIQGSNRFLSPKTGEILTRRKWTELPVPEDVIEQLKELKTDKIDLQVLNIEDEEDVRNDEDQINTEEENKNDIEENLDEALEGNVLHSPVNNIEVESIQESN